MTEITLGVSIACALVGVAALFLFRDRVESIGRHGIRLRPSDSDQRHAQEMADAEKRHSEAIDSLAQTHSNTHANDQKTIERLTLSNAQKDNEIAALKARISDLEKQLAPLKNRPPFTGFQ